MNTQWSISEAAAVEKAEWVFSKIYEGDGFIIRYCTAAHVKHPKIYVWPASPGRDLQDRFCNIDNLLRHEPAIASILYIDENGKDHVVYRREIYAAEWVI